MIVCVCQLLCSKAFASANFLRFRIPAGVLELPSSMRLTDNRIWRRQSAKNTAKVSKIMMFSEKHVLPMEVCISMPRIPRNWLSFQSYLRVQHVYVWCRSWGGEVRKRMSAEKRTILRVVFPVEKSERWRLQWYFRCSHAANLVRMFSIFEHAGGARDHSKSSTNKDACFDLRHQKGTPFWRTCSFETVNQAVAVRVLR